MILCFMLNVFLFNRTYSLSILVYSGLIRLYASCLVTLPRCFTSSNGVEGPCYSTIVAIIPSP